VTRVSENAPPDIRHLLDNREFIRRHIACTSDDDIASMLHVIGVENPDELMDAVVPERIRSRAPLDLPDPQPEWDVIDRLCSLAAFNRPRTSLIGMGYTNTVTPAVIRRNLLENPAWYTSYTPYQPEISQGRLESLLNLQSLISDLTGLPIANASLLDEATAAAEAMTMAQRSSRHASTTMFVHDDTHPQTIAVMATRAEPLGISLRIGSPADFDPEDVFAALFSYPTSTGSIADVRLPIDRLHEAGGLAIISTDPLACVLLESPGSRGADIQSARLSVSVYHSVSVVLTLRSCPRPRHLRGCGPGDSSVSARMPTTGQHWDWRCRLGSSTFVERRQPRTSAPHRHFWQMWQQCTRYGTDLKDSNALPSASMPSHRWWQLTPVQSEWNSFIPSSSTLCA